MLRSTFLLSILIAGCSPSANSATSAPPTANASGSSTAAPDPVSPESPPDAQTNPPGKDYACGKITGTRFQAWVNAMPGPNRTPTLIVTGTVETPTGGWTVKFTDIRVAESYPVQVTALLSATQPPDMATQAVVEHEVRGSWPMFGPVGSVTVKCGFETLARISPVETAQ